MKKINQEISHKHKLKIIEELSDEGYSRAEISKLINLSPQTVSNYLCARNAGFERWADKLNYLAKNKGYRTHAHKTKVESYAKNPNKPLEKSFNRYSSMQNRFEERIIFEEEKDQIDFNNIQQTEITIDLEGILERFGKQPKTHGREIDSKGKIQILARYYLNGETLEEIGEDLGYTRANISLLKIQALKDLRDFLKKENLYNYFS